MSDASLVILARAPELGRVKTRLAATIGAASTLRVYHHLLARVADVARGWPGAVTLMTTGADAAWDGSALAHLPRTPQPDGGLGRRIAAALRLGLSQAPCAVVIGTDCPGLTAAHLERLAATATPAAFGPADDGGYWGLALTDPAVIAPCTGDDLPWSTPALLDATRDRLAVAGLACATTEVLRDCDDADDLAAAIAAGFLPPLDAHR
jgi:hypothetical protein